MHLPSLSLALLTGCILADSAPPVEARLTATWDVRHVDGTIVPCDGEATVVARSDTTNPFLATFDCADGTGTIDVEPGVYDADVEIAGFSPSLSQSVDLSVADQTAAFDVYDDGGYLALGWTLVGAASKDTLPCGIAGATDVDVGLGVTTLPCAAGSGTFGPIVAGTYVVTVAARSPVGTVGTATSIATAVHGANQVTDLGNVAISIAGK